MISKTTISIIVGVTVGLFPLRNTKLVEILILITGG